LIFTIYIINIKKIIKGIDIQIFLISYEMFATVHIDQGSIYLYVYLVDITECQIGIENDR